MARKRVARQLLLFFVILFKDVAPMDDEHFAENQIWTDNDRLETLQDHAIDFEETIPQPIESNSWQGPENLGQISGVAVDTRGRPTIFHRANRIWDYNTFNMYAEYQEKDQGPIMENTVLILDPSTGEILHGWGKQMFYLPHGIFIDNSDNVWLTDVALHQVFKFSNTGETKIVLGKSFEPGNDLEHFCQPTAVAIAASGEVVIADGYCNSRLVIFDPEGNPKYSIGERWIDFRIPHSLTILPNSHVCVADRENARVACLNVGLSGSNDDSEGPYFIQRHVGRVFAITSFRGVIYGVSGMSAQKMRTKGFTIGPRTRSVVAFWDPETGFFTAPHAIAICPNGTALYVSEIGPNKIWKFDLLRINKRY